MNEVWTLSWDVRNANEQTGCWAFASQQLAIEQALIWIGDDLGDYASETDLRKDLEDGYAELSEDRSYSIASSRIRTEVEQ